jgi:hypothetical protein
MAAMTHAPQRRSGGRREAVERTHERPADPAEAADRPLVPKESRDPSPHRPDPPHHDLNNPVGEPDPTADSDPFQKERGAE